MVIDLWYEYFRHTFATNALKQGLDLKSVQMLLGDNDPEMVLRIYANMTKIEILEAHQKFTALYENELKALRG
ncbi:tyrosine-type recombinase/integrase [Clostridium aminobutyricum]|uniref:Tyrosine-type recombinase/integrase n=1 Tax=Clostridium aminobutyricum TaxID=33953 RepID=A0A939DB27_CLOAM|nr:tyrosine-type recombinase/integrase [Clostridium aminobutyricum]MBN7774465.1 tyrosine-type recombinase/integrase [Clostridium aminobutyricum]